MLETSWWPLSSLGIFHLGDCFSFPAIAPQYLRNYYAKFSAYSLTHIAKYFLHIVKTSIKDSKIVCDRIMHKHGSSNFMFVNFDKELPLFSLMCHFILTKFVKFYFWNTIFFGILRRHFCKDIYFLYIVLVDIW